MMIKTTFPRFEPSIKKSKKPLFTIIEISYHTILPILLTYLIITYEMPLLFPILLIPILIRFNPKIITTRK